MEIFRANTTPIPNYVLDGWIGKMTPEEFVILMLLFRISWHYRDVVIYLKEIEKKTGLERKVIKKCLSLLKEKHFLPPELDIGSQIIDEDGEKR